MEIHLEGFSKKMTDEITFLVKYISELESEGFSIKECLCILIASFTAIIEGSSLKESSLEIILDSIRIGFKKTRKYREKMDCETSASVKDNPYNENHPS